MAELLKGKVCAITGGATGIGTTRSVPRPVRRLPDPV